MEDQSALQWFRARHPRPRKWKKHLEDMDCSSEIVPIVSLLFWWSMQFPEGREKYHLSRILLHKNKHYKKIVIHIAKGDTWPRLTERSINTVWIFTFDGGVVHMLYKHCREWSIISALIRSCHGSGLLLRCQKVVWFQFGLVGWGLAQALRPIGFAALTSRPHRPFCIFRQQFW